MRAYHTATCKGCGESFQTRAPDPTYCSKSCSNRARAGYGRVDRVCERCGAEFQAYRSEAERGGGRFCSHECADAANVGKRTKLETRPCERCGNPVTRKPSEFGEHTYCSKSCAGKANHPVDREKKVERVRQQGGRGYPIGTRTIRSDGYVNLKTERGWELEHRVVAEQNGRSVAGKHVHHENGQRNDNRPENLSPLSPPDHHALHTGPMIEANRLAPGKWSREHERCIRCERTDHPHARNGLCTKCAQYVRYHALHPDAKSRRGRDA